MNKTVTALKIWLLLNISVLQITGSVMAQTAPSTQEKSTSARFNPKVWEALRDEINIGKDPIEKERLFNEYVRTNGATLPNAGYLEQLEARLARAFISVPDTTRRDTTKFKFYTDKLPMKERGWVYRDAIDRFGQRGIYPELSKELAGTLARWSGNELTNPTEKKDPKLTEQAWKEARESEYALNAGVYAHVLYRAGDYREGLPYAKDAAFYSKYNNPIYNSDYALLLEKTAKPVEVVAALSPLIKEGAIGSELINVIRRAIMQTEGSEQKADAYITILRKKADTDRKNALVKKMLDAPAPDFTLKNMNGEEVSLAALKGKVVVLDFWATWCGPCKRSFPIMQKMIEKYKHDPDVVFLFIDTWESLPEAQREKEVSDYITQHKFDFNVLYDTQRVKGVQDSYTLKNSYRVTAIPAKFVIGKDGRIRFNSVGYMGTNADDNLIQELSDMIEIAGGK